MLMQHQEDDSLENIPEGYKLIRANGPIIIQIRDQWRGCIIPAVFSLFALTDVFSEPQISTLQIICWTAVLLLFFVYCLLCTISTHTITINDQEIIDFEGYKKIGRKKGFKFVDMNKMERIEIKERRSRMNALTYYVIKVYSMKNGVQSLLYSIRSHEIERIDFLENLFNKAIANYQKHAN